MPISGFLVPSSLTQTPVRPGVSNPHVEITVYRALVLMRAVSFETPTTVASTLAGAVGVPKHMPRTRSGAARATAQQ